MEAAKLGLHGWLASTLRRAALTVFGVDDCSLCGPAQVGRNHQKYTAGKEGGGFAMVPVVAAAVPLHPARPGGCERIGACMYCKSLSPANNGNTKLATSCSTAIHDSAD
jgi:hypothetical protein